MSQGIYLWSIDLPEELSSGAGHFSIYHRAGRLFRSIRPRNLYRHSRLKYKATSGMRKKVKIGE
jgi:hypothetical protein